MHLFIGLFVDWKVQAKLNIQGEIVQWVMVWPGGVAL